MFDPSNEIAYHQKAAGMEVNVVFGSSFSMKYIKVEKKMITKNEFAFRHFPPLEPVNKTMATICICFLLFLRVKAKLANPIFKFTALFNLLPNITGTKSAQFGYPDYP